MGFDASGSNACSRRGGGGGGGGSGSGGGGSGSGSGSGGSGSGRRKQQQQQQPATVTSKRQQKLQKRYGWDGNKVVSLDGEGEESEKRGGGSPGEQQQKRRYHQESKRLALAAASSATRSLERALDACHRSFFPDPSSVSPDYWSYCRWRGAHRLCSSMLTNFATQALLAAVGVGASRSLPAAAGINWLLKDGLGRVGRLGVATRFGEAFDADIKRFRFATSVLFTASVGLELATPAFPRQFLALAAAANVGKAVGLTTYISTQPSFGASFARGANLADVTAKAQAQQMVVDTLGLALCVATLRRVGVQAAAAGARAGAASTVASAAAASAAAASVNAAGTEAAAAAAKSASVAFRRSFSGGVPLPLLALLAAGDLFCIAKELKSVHLRTLNRERAELAAEAWLAGRGRTTRSSGEEGEGVEEEEKKSGGLFDRRRRRREPDAPSSAASSAPSPEAIAEAEPLLFPARLGNGILPLRFSRLEHAGVSSKQELDDALSRRSKGNDKFLLVRVAPKKKSSESSSSSTSSLRLVLRSDARAADALVGVLAAAHARAEILEQEERNKNTKKQTNNTSNNKKESSSSSNSSSSSSSGDNNAGDDDSSAEQQQQQLLLSRATAAARRDGPAFYEALEDAGWQMEPFLLSPTERGGLVMLG